MQFSANLNPLSFIKEPFLNLEYKWKMFFVLFTKECGPLADFWRVITPVLRDKSVPSLLTFVLKIIILS